MKWTRALLRVWLFGVVLVANSAYVTACSGNEESDQFTYGEAELLELLDQVNATESWTFAGYELSLDLEQQAGEATARAEGIVRSAHACGTRTFVKSAAACIDVTEMPVEGTATVVALLDDGTTRMLATLPVSGEAIATGLDLEWVQLSLYFDGGSMMLSWQHAGAFELSSFGADSLGAEGVPVNYTAH